MINKIIFTIISILLTTGATAKDIEFKLSQYKIRQGETLKITLHSNNPITNGKIAFNNKKYEIFKHKKNQYISYIGISRNLVPKKYQIAIKGTINSTPFYQKKAIHVLKGHFKKSSIKLKGKKRTLSKNKKAISTEANTLTSILKIVTKERIFQTFFKTPTQGKLTTRFGAYRIYNGVPRGKHSGVDYANNIGTPVFAANNGVVVLSKFLNVHGHTIIIDHGWGINTIYNHLHRRFVKKGDRVNQKIKIGEIGNTGVSTGPHLHWGMSIQNTRVDPLYWVKNDFLY